MNLNEFDSEKMIYMAMLFETFLIKTINSKNIQWEIHWQLLKVDHIDINIFDTLQFQYIIKFGFVASIFLMIMKKWAQGKISGNVFHKTSDAYNVKYNINYRKLLMTNN